jgi:hypothetical protein
VAEGALPLKVKVYNVFNLVTNSNGTNASVVLERGRGLVELSYGEGTKYRAERALIQRIEE